VTEQADVLAESREFNPMVCPHRDDPNPFYKWSREEEPISYSSALGAYVVTRYDDLQSIANDPDTFSSLPAVPSVWNNPPEVVEALEGCIPEAVSLVNTDEPKHMPVRRVFELTFSGRRVRRLSGAMHDRANELVDRFEADGSADLVTQFANPYVRHVLSLAIGIPPEDIEKVDAWVRSWMTLFSPLLPVEEKLRAVKDYKDYEQYALDLIEQRRRDRRDDLVSDMVHGGDGVDPVSLEDALYLFRGANSAGFDTTRDTIGATVLMLMQNRDLWDRELSDRRRISRVIEEALRKDSPHRGLMRKATRDVDIHGVAVPAGSLLLLLFGSGNRDERIFADPDRADIDRPNIREHLAFGHGLHHCVGAPLARAEAATAIEVLRTRLPQMHLAPHYTPSYEASYFFRSLERLEVTW
jgi:cytochrome P450